MKATLNDLLRTRWEDIHLLHKDVEVEPCTIVELDSGTLTAAGQEAWSFERRGGQNLYRLLRLAAGAGQGEAPPLGGILVHACRALSGIGL